MAVLLGWITVKEGGPIHNEKCVPDTFQIPNQTVIPYLKLFDLVMSIYGFCYPTVLDTYALK